MCMLHAEIHAVHVMHNRLQFQAPLLDLENSTVTADQAGLTFPSTGTAAVGCCL